jgi:hypothetical protein
MDITTLQVEAQRFSENAHVKKNIPIFNAI